MKNYPGSKGNSRIMQFFINKIPFHNRYFELFAGSAQLFRNKKPAAENYLNDINTATVFNLMKSTFELVNNIVIEGNQCHFKNFDIYQILDKFQFTLNDFIYLDPPYPKEDRRSGAKLYKFEMLEAEKHLKLLKEIKLINANIMISTGPNTLYQEQLHNWNRYQFKTIGHQGPRIEVIYTNYDKPEFLHQYDFYGDNFTRRQQIKRISERFNSRLERIDSYERHIIIKEIIQSNYLELKHFMKNF